MSLTSFSATVTRRCPLGRVVAMHDLNGPDEYQVRAFAEVLEAMKNGETLELALTRNLPADHPLSGIDLDAASHVPAPELAAPDESPEETLLGLAAYAARVVDTTDGIWPPAVRATERGRALQHIEAECRRVHAAVTTDEGAER